MVDEMPEHATRERWTYAEFARLPSDGNRYEVIAGGLHVSAAPRPFHQNIVCQLARLLRAVAPALPALAALACGALFPPEVDAQVGGDLILGAGGGVTFYCLDTRCDSGTTLLASFGYAPTPHVVVVGSGRWHGCFDCHRFLMVEGSLHVRHPGPTWQPYAAAGLSMMSDPEFIGTRFGGHAGAGTWWWPSPSWGLQAEVRGRHVGRGAGIIEVSLAVAHRRF